MNLEKMIPDDYGELENSDLALSEGRIRRHFREEMSEERGPRQERPEKR